MVNVSIINIEPLSVARFMVSILIKKNVHLLKNNNYDFFETEEIIKKMLKKTHKTYNLFFDITLFRKVIKIFETTKSKRLSVIMKSLIPNEKTSFSDNTLLLLIQNMYKELIKHYNI